MTCKKSSHHIYLITPKFYTEVVRDSPWKLLVAVMLLNKTSGHAALPIFWLIIWTWPTPELLSMANIKVLTYILSPLGLQNVRATRLIALSRMIVQQPPQAHILHKSRAKPENGSPYPSTAISHLPGCGKYALDSYRIFCLGDSEWKGVFPDDKELKKYLKWKWAIEEFKKWNYVDGVVGDVDRSYLEQLPLELLSTNNRIL